jgi:hypothetical protein
MYGPHRDNGLVLHYKVGSDLKEFVPIGRPIANTRFGCSESLLNSSLNLE